MVLKSGLLAKKCAKVKSKSRDRCYLTHVHQLIIILLYAALSTSMAEPLLLFGSLKSWCKNLKLISAPVSYSATVARLKCLHEHLHTYHTRIHSSREGGDGAARKQTIDRETLISEPKTRSVPRPSQQTWSSASHISSYEMYKYSLQKRTVPTFAPGFVNVYEQQSVSRGQYRCWFEVLKEDKDRKVWISQRNRDRRLPSAPKGKIVKPAWEPQ